MKIAAYIPIKLNSVRTPGKNIKPLSDGTPLCELMFETLDRTRNIDEKYCFCSDESIKKYLKGTVHFLKRNPYLDGNEVKCNEIIRSFIDIVSPDIVVLTHVTSPFLKAETIEECVEKVKSGKYDSAFTVYKIQELLWKDGKPLNFDAACTPRTQDLPIIYGETNGVFVFTREVFEKTGRRVGKNPFFYELNFPETIDINYPEDFLITNAVYTENLRTRSD